MYSDDDVGGRASLLAELDLLNESILAYSSDNKIPQVLAKIRRVHSPTWRFIYEYFPTW
jgi:hypothetical protein